MTDAGRYELGAGKYRLGRDGKFRTSFTIEEDQHQMLEKMRVVKGFEKSEVVQVALETLFSMPMRDIEAKIQGRRGRL